MNPQYHIKAELPCGSLIEIIQHNPGGLFTIVLTTPDSIPISDAATIKDGSLTVRSSQDSLIGVYQLLRLLINPPAPKKTWWDKLFS
jgi:hypothetical protein